MYNNIYQEYINNMIGTMPRNQPDFELATYRDTGYIQSQNTGNVEIEKLYPDLYKLLYPMVQAACMRNTKPITEETIDEMTKDIYSSFNADDVTILNINLTNDVRTAKINDTQKISAKNLPAEKKNNEEKETRNSRPNNYVLNDLIRILIIRELLGRPGNVPGFRPGFPPGRPPFAPREIGFDRQNYDIYEHFNF